MSARGVPGAEQEMVFAGACEDGAAALAAPEGAALATGAAVEDVAAEGEVDGVGWATSSPWPLRPMITQAMAPATRTTTTAMPIIR